MSKDDGYTLKMTSLTDKELYEWVVRSKACWKWYGQILEYLTVEAPSEIS